MKQSVAVNMAIVALLSLSCKTEGRPQPPNSLPEVTLPFVGDYDITTLEVTDEFTAKATSLGEVNDINEASGLAASTINPGYLWTHEDSGADAEVILLNRWGKVVVSYQLKDAQNVDWEDMATGPGPDAGSKYLYLADIGDNNAKRDDVVIYRIKEPIYNPADSGKTIEVTGVEQLTATYPKGARDAETLMIDPLSRDIFVVTKREDSVQLFELTYPQGWGDVDTFSLRGTFPFTGITGGDISEDGKRVLLKSYSAIFYWKMEQQEPISHLLSRKPQRAPYNPVEFQGEAICWFKNNYYTLSEKVAGFTPKLYLYSKR
jgi:hypothetical protein